MNAKQHALMLRLAYDHMCCMVEQSQQPPFDDEHINEVLTDAATLLYKVSLQQQLNADEREVVQALIDMTIEGELTTDEDRKLAFEISDLI